VVLLRDFVELDDGQQLVMLVFAPTSSGRHTGKGINGQGIQPHGLEFIEFSKFIGLIEFIEFMGLI
jgi:hypothetical protein